jgi:molybdopterin synthase sulfur carrier subunit
MLKATFYATLRRIVNGKTIEFDLPSGSTVQQLLDEMIRRYPPLREELLDENGQLFQHVHIFVNARDTLFLPEGMNSPLMEEDTIGVFPVVGGG